MHAIPFRNWSCTCSTGKNDFSLGVRRETRLIRTFTILIYHMEVESKRYDHSVFWAVWWEWSTCLEKISVDHTIVFKLEIEEFEVLGWCKKYLRKIEVFLLRGLGCRKWPQFDSCDIVRLVFTIKCWFWALSIFCTFCSIELEVLYLLKRDGTIVYDPNVLSYWG